MVGVLLDAVTSYVGTWVADETYTRGCHALSSRLIVCHVLLHPSEGCLNVSICFLEQAKRVAKQQLLDQANSESAALLNELRGINDQEKASDRSLKKLLDACNVRPCVV